MNQRRITEQPQRPEPTPVLKIMRQMQELSYRDFVSLAQYLDMVPMTLSSSLDRGVSAERLSSKEAIGSAT